MDRRAFLGVGMAALATIPLEQKARPTYPAFPLAKGVPRHIVATDFNVIGDGLTDNTAALAAALRALSQNGAGSFFFPPGRYLYSHIDAEVSSLEMFGRDAVLISTLPVETSLPAIWLRGAEIHIHDLDIDYAVPLDVRSPGVVESRKPNAYGLRVGGRRDPTPLFASSVVLERLMVSNARGGAIQVSKASNASVSACTIRQALGNGIGFDGCPSNITAKDNSIESTGDDMLVVVTDYTVPDGTRNAIFSRNRLSNGFAKGIASTGVDGFIVEDNIISNTFAGAIAIIQDNYYGLGGSKNVTVRRNYIRQAGMNFGPRLFRSSPSSVGDSIYVSSGTSNVSIQANDMADGQRDGIVFSKCDVVYVEHNLIKRHPGRAVVLGDPTSLLKRITQFGVSRNIISEVSVGIVIGAASSGKVLQNTIDVSSIKQGTGMILGRLTDVAVSANIVKTSALDHGIRMLDSSIPKAYLGSTNKVEISS
jgi:hypothetical protein